MSVLDKLKQEGCFLTPEGLEIVGITDQAVDAKTLLKKVLDFDLREIGAPAFPEDFCKSGSKCESLEEPIFVQIQKIHNISAPKANEESKHAPRMLKLTLTDGHLTCQAIEVENIPGLSINTPPGTKIQLKPGPLTTAHGFLFMGPTSINILGGQVLHMVEKWELNQSLAKHTRGNLGGEGAPPPWIPFGKPLDGRDPLDKSFKSLQETVKQDNIEFEAQRMGAIAEAQKLSGTKKVFGGGTKPMLDSNVQKIVDAGFSEEQAENALKITRNNADKALKNLQRREVAAEAKKERAAKPTAEIGLVKGGRKGRNKDGTDEEGLSAVKPSGKVSLFDFLENKLPAVTETEKPKVTEPQTYHKEENKYDRSNGERRGGHVSRGGGRGGPGGTRGPPPRQPNSYQGMPNRNDYSQNNSNPFNQNENQRGYNNYHREERPQHNYNSQQIPNEKAPRFQKKYDGESRRQAVNINMAQESPYPPNYQQPPNNYYPDRRNAPDNRSPKNFYPPSSMEAVTDAAAALSFNTNPQNRYNNRQSNMFQNNYPNNFNYPPKPNYNQTPYDPNFKRNQYSNNVNNPNNAKQTHPQNATNGQSVNPSFYNPYPNNQATPNQPNQQKTEDQEALMGRWLTENNSQPTEQANRYSGRGNGFYQAANIVGFQNASINEQARKMLAEGTQIMWNIGDRCLAKYWEDNGFYDAEITGISSRTVVVRFLAYGNHEEVLKADCLPPNTPVARPFVRDCPMGVRESGGRGGRFHQPMYVPPAQRKA